MKISFVLVWACAILSLKKSHGSAIGTPFYPLNPEDLSQGDVKEIEYWNKHYYRPKRTISPILGSAEALIQLKTSILAGSKMKIIEIAKGSASSVAAASAGTQTALGSAAKGLLGSAGGIFQLKNALEAEIQKKIGQAFRSAAGASTGAIVAASTGAGNAAVGTVSGSSTAIHQLKSAAFKSIAAGSASINLAKNSLIAGIAKSSTNLATASSAKVKTTLANSSNAIHQLKSAIINHIFASSAKVATGASSGIQTKVKQVSGDIVAGGVDVANQLKTAVVAGTKQKLGKAASGLAGAITGAVGSASAGLGQFARGGIAGTINIANQVKEETNKKIGQVFRASGNAIGQVALGSAGAVSNLQNAKNSLSNHLANFARGAIAAATSASSGIKSGTFQLITAASGQASKHLKAQISQVFQGSSAKAQSVVSGLKSAALGKLQQIAQGSVLASGQAVSGTKSALAGSANAVQQLKSAALSHVANKVKQVAQGSLAASGQVSSGIKSAIANKVKQVAQGSLAASGQVSSGIKSAIANKVKQVAQGSLSASGQASSGTKSAISGSASGVYQLKSAALSHVTNKLGELSSGIKHGVHQQVSNLAEASAERRKRSISESIQDRSHVAVELPKRSESAWSSSGSGSGSSDIINQIKSAVVAGLKQKLAQVAKGSAGAVAGASAGFSKGSSGGGDHYYHHTTYESSPHHPPDEHKTWDVKKSVFNTLLQAVKAIKGGVLAIKGQLIKGSGYLVAGGGKLIAASGDKVTKLGKNVLSNALSGHKEHYTHSDYVSHPSGYTAPSGPPSYDAPPSSSGHGYESHYESHPSHYDKPSGPNHAGILILRRMPSSQNHHDKYHSSHSNVDESVVPPFKPLAPTGPTFGTVVGKFFSASTSLSPSAPAPFTHADIHPYEHQNDVVEESHGYLNPPSPPHFEEPQAAPANFQATLNQQDSVENYGVPLEDPLSYQNLNFNDHSGSASSVNEQKVKLTKGELNDPIASSEIHVADDAPASLQALKTSQTLGPPFSAKFMSKNINYLKNALFAEQEKQSDFLPRSESQEASNELSSKERYMKFLENFPVRKSRPAPGYSSRSKRPSASSSELVKSVSFKLTPEGITRLT